ncbi:MAG: adenosylcobinamide-GDP ribazoletransferase [Acidobacteriaceae bacterium]|jgi:adenosylcobinamide-GDP ribazoletransferase|nr:adenosylcobinamide-GDP ribazoletransferase [Acidobacteriaceae bacterium]
MKWIDDFLVAAQFLTRFPVPRVRFDPDSLSRAAKFFPVVGLIIGLGASVLQRIAAPHLSHPLVALLVLTFLVLITSGLHEDGLADTADGFGGGWNREQVLTILRDSRIGSFGALALVLSVLARFLLLSSLPVNRFTAFIVSAHVLCRWTTLPLSYFLAPARESDGQGARIAQKISPASLLICTLLSFAIVFYFMRTQFWIPVLVAFVITALSGLYYSRRIGGVTGDCFGATNQLTEIAVYFCGVWNL